MSSDEVSSLHIAVEDYAEYKRIVGDDDGGVPFEQDKYDEYIKRMTPIRLNNRIYVSWSNSDGVDCKLIGPETECFCNHRYKEHQTDFEVVPDERPILQPCRISGCACMSYHYVPIHGKHAIKCSCKHYSYDHHAAQPYLCSYDTCKCEGFSMSHTCACGQSAKHHRTVSETKAERSTRGHPVGQDTLYQAMGGLTGFSSMLDGYQRLDPSGLGVPSYEFLEQPITSSDHPFLRSNVNSIAAHNHANAAPQEVIDADLAERMSQMRRPGESELAFYERRYKERQKDSRGRNRPMRGLTAPRPGGSHTPSDDPDMNFAIVQAQQASQAGSHMRGGGYKVRGQPRQSPAPRTSQPEASDLIGLSVSGTSTSKQGNGTKSKTKK